MSKQTIPLLTLLALGACSAPPASTDGEAIVALSGQWQAALNNGDIDALVAMYTDDARVLAPNEPIAAGSSAVRNVFSAMISAGFTGELKTVEARIAGDIGYHVGTYSLQAEGQPVDSGKFVELWRRTDDGWKISSDIWNSNAHAAMPEESNPHLVVIHQVADAEKWQAAWRGDNSRHKLFARHGAAHVHTFQHAENPKLTGLIISVADMGAVTALLQSEEGTAAAAEDGVDMSTLQVFNETR